MGERNIEMMMIEGRRSERVRSFLRARILFNGGSSTIDCMIKNISSHGAKIEISSTLSVPAEFDLEVPQRGKTYRARMMWRAAQSIGVEFTQPCVTADDAQAIIQRLETENRKLRTLVTTLTQRLEALGQAV